MSLISEHLCLLKMDNIRLSLFVIFPTWDILKGVKERSGLQEVGRNKRWVQELEWGLVYCLEIIVLGLFTPAFLVPRLLAAMSCPRVSFPLSWLVCSSPCWYPRDNCWVKSLCCFEEIRLEDHAHKLESHGSGYGKPHCKVRIINNLMNFEKISE